MKLPGWTRHLLTESHKDPIPTWLIGLASALSAASILYGASKDPSGFLLNVAASMALVGPGLFITNRVVRNWNDRRLRPVLRDVTAYLLLVLKWLRKDLNGLGVDLQIETPELGDGRDTRDTLSTLASCAASWKATVEERAMNAPDGTATVRQVRRELTVSQAVEQLDRNMDRLDVALDLSQVKAQRERMQSAAQAWEAHRGNDDQALDVLVAAGGVLDSIGSLASQLNRVLPKHLT